SVRAGRAATTFAAALPVRKTRSSLPSATFLNCTRRMPGNSRPSPTRRFSSHREKRTRPSNWPRPRPQGSLRAITTTAKCAEKSACASVVEAWGIVQRCHETGLFVQVGRQRRYAPAYNLAMSMARNGLLGRINHVDMQWHRNHYWRRPVDLSYPLNDIEKTFIKDIELHLNSRLYDE